MYSSTATLLLAMTVAGTAPAEPTLNRYTYSEAHMGTRFKIILYAANESAAQKAAKAAFERIAALDTIMSDYRSTSELMQLCQKAGGDPVVVSADLFRVLNHSQDLARQSEGAFDVTVGPVVRLWRTARKTKKLPDPDELKRARALVGYDNIRLDHRKQTVQLLKPGMQLDLGAVGKGYAADAALDVLKKHGVDRALVAAGGDIVASGPPPDKEGWNVGIAPLLDPDAAPTRFLLLKDAAVSTAGDAEQFVEIEGKRYSHIVDPRTGLGLLGRQSVTVVAPRGVISDGLDTAACVLGPERGLKLVDATPGAAALFIRKTDNKEETFQSTRFKDLKQQGQ